ncbi:hypothetical protein [Companilactobacillus versmoldensis]|uniref:Uncharacterized protein n=1 Tax=Companilactobacillus versmoldensis DSM 14857 = KCTC 3814 TaxID=1423815 RepID=A0A0R1SLZ8_9LACO|nr:hypothetical protein [Companilactobacillus versmoldensis]KRL67032.1 hypothetical protein FC27_GL002148 [Companilactobacillus versmoldensis DSM 14857 = KCTC 3814]
MRTRIFEILYWLVVGSLAISAVLLFFINSTTSLKLSAYTLLLLLAKQYVESVNDENQSKLKIF